MKSRFLKGALVGVGALILSTVGIFASDVFQGIDGGIGNIANVGGGRLCPGGMFPYKGSEGDLCVDAFEASVAPSCPHESPRNVFESEKNVATDGCYAASVEGKEPWTFVTLAQAQRVCVSSGKRLPTSDEWYVLSLGTNGTDCMVKGTEPRETSISECRSAANAYDMVGNVWEWVNETVAGSEYHSRTLPSEGYVNEADASGIAIQTDPSTGSELYGNDYFWSDVDGVFGMIRGGFYGSGDDAGLYTVNASVPTNFATQGVGFRCVMSI